MKDSDDFLKDFFDDKTYSVNSQGFSRWIDQKCTADVLWLVSDLIISYTELKSPSFNASSVWHFSFSDSTINEYFSKASTADETAQHEFDKFFSQPMCLLCFAGVLKDVSNNAGHKYVINDNDMLNYIAANDTCALRFLQTYIEKVLNDIGFYIHFKKFFDSQDKTSFRILKDKFVDFYHANTPIQGNYEPKRIFTKVLNPLAFKYGKKGTIGGRLSRYKIRRSDLMYNQDNFRDIYTHKPKDISRQDWLLERNNHVESEYYNQAYNRSKKNINENIVTYRNCISELSQYSEAYPDISFPSQIHHIFPKNEYPELIHYAENLIALTPNQHLLYAHPKNNTNAINPDAQKELLIAKIRSIQHNFESEKEKRIYDFNNLLEVIRTGLDIVEEDVQSIQENDFDAVIRVVNKYALC